MKVIQSFYVWAARLWASMNVLSFSVLSILPIMRWLLSQSSKQLRSTMHPDPFKTNSLVYFSWRIQKSAGYHLIYYTSNTNAKVSFSYSSKIQGSSSKIHLTPSLPDYCIPHGLLSSLNLSVTLKKTYVDPLKTNKSMYRF